MPKLFSILGDSISTLHGYTPAEGAFYHTAFSQSTGIASVEDTWWMKVIKGCGGDLLVNDSYAGSTVCRDGYQPASAPWRLAKLKQKQIAPDCILIYSGLNDVAFYRTPSEFEEAYTSMLLEMKSQYPNAEIWCGTLCEGLLTNPSLAPFLNFKHCTSLSEYNACIRSSANATGCQVADIAAFGQAYSSMDGVHPNAVGMEQLAQMWLQCMLPQEPPNEKQCHP